MTEALLFQPGDEVVRLADMATATVQTDGSVMFDDGERIGPTEHHEAMNAGYGWGRNRPPATAERRPRAPRRPLRVEVFERRAPIILDGPEVWIQVETDNSVSLAMVIASMTPDERRLVHQCDRSTLTYLPASAVSPEIPKSYLDEFYWVMRKR